MDDAGLVSAVTHLTGLGILHGFGRVRRHGADLGVRHQTARAQHLAQLADDAHRVRRSDDHVVVQVAGQHLLGQVVHAHGFGAGCDGFIGLGTGGGEHGYTHRLAGTGWQHGGTTHLLVGLLGIHAEAHGHVDGFHELGLAVVLDDLQRFINGVRLARGYRGKDRFLSFGLCHRLSPLPSSPCCGPNPQSYAPPLPARLQSSRLPSPWRFLPTACG